MITTERIGGTTCFDVDGQRLTIAARNGRVSLHVCDCRTDDFRPASMGTEDAAHLLRAMLREIEGPSIDDLAHLFDVPRALVEVVRASNGSDVLVRIGLYTYTGATRREAMQAAWDAGVEMYGGDT